MIRHSIAGIRWRCRHLSLMLLLIFLACAPQFNIRTWPIEFSAQRLDLTRDYLGRHYFIRSDNIRIFPKIIVLHWTGLESLALSFKAFNRTTFNSGSELNVSAHYLIDRDGAIYQLMPDRWMANHIFGLNYFAIGIENVGGAASKDDLTVAQIEANAALIRFLIYKYPRIEYLIGHHEYPVFFEHPLFIEKTQRKPPVKIDPGTKFMREVRLRVADLNLKGPAEIKQEASAAQQSDPESIQFRRY